MSEIIKCPICHKMAGIRYDINRVYQSRCQNMECRETVTVTASSEAAAEELFSRFEKGTNQPQLTIPKSVADELESVFAGIDATDLGYVLDQTGPYGSRAFNDYYFKNKNIIALYLAGKALGVDLVKVVEGIDDNY